MPTELNKARLKLARELRGLSQVELSAAVGVTNTLSGQWERGQREPSLGYLKALAKVLGVSVGWLLGMDEAEPGRISEAAGSGLARSALPDSAGAVLSDYGAPVGLRDLAGQAALVQALAIDADEWAALGSLRFGSGLTLPGYLGLLVLLRTAGLSEEQLAIPSRSGRPVGGVRASATRRIDGAGVTES
jgi:transcriptional regulator with XRE-family HTH domain